LVLRSRPDVVATWDDDQVARRWLLLCPIRKHADGSAKEPSQAERILSAPPALLGALVIWRSPAFPWTQVGQRPILDRAGNSSTHHRRQLWKQWTWRTLKSA
jgi:hypothetical protein